MILFEFIVPHKDNFKEKIPSEGEFTLRTNPWAGLIASTGSFYLMVFLLWKDG